MVSERRVGADSWPVKAWALVGVSALVLQSIVWVRYAASGPTSLTRYRTPEASSYGFAKAFELGLLVLVSLTVGLTVRSAVKPRRVTTHAMLLFAFASMLWVDPMLKYLRPGFYFSENLLNVESWVQFIPVNSPRTRI
jgi:hypothetical protein